MSKFVCQGCKYEILDGVFIETDTSKYHEECFCCSFCRTKMIDEYVSVVDVNHQEKLFCDQHKMMAKATTVCSRCQHELTVNSLALMVDNQHFHPECLTCARCSVRITTVFTVDRTIYCEVCVGFVNAPSSSSISQQINEEMLTSNTSSNEVLSSSGVSLSPSGSSPLSAVASPSSATAPWSFVHDNQWSINGQTNNQQNSFSQHQQHIDFNMNGVAAAAGMNMNSNNATAVASYALSSRSSIGSDEMSPVGIDHMMYSAATNSQQPPPFVFSAVDVDAELFDVSVQSGIDSDNWFSFSSTSETSSMYGAAAAAVSSVPTTMDLSSSNNQMEYSRMMMSDAETSLFAARMTVQQLNTLRFELNRSNDYSELAAISEKLRMVKSQLNHWKHAMNVQYLPQHASKSELLRRAPADPCGKLRYCLDQITAYIAECFAYIVDHLRSHAYVNHELLPMCGMVTNVLQIINSSPISA